MMATAVTIARSLYRDAVEGPMSLLRLRATYPSATVHAGVRLHGRVQDCLLGDQATICGPSVLSVAAGGGLSNSRLEVGHATYVGEFANIRCGGTAILIGPQCMVGQHVSIIGSNHGTAPGISLGEQPWTGDGVTIDAGAWIGAGAILLPGSRVGAGAVVAAGSVVRGEVEAGTIVAGVPAQLKRNRQ